MPGGVISDCDLAWLAGLYEGEGSLFFSRGYPQLTIAMKDSDVIERVYRLTGFGKIYVMDPKGPDADKEYALSYRWRSNCRPHIKMFFDAVWPYLGRRRREQAAMLYRSSVEPTLF